ncbi:hypothetical protein KM043_000123 [Ampulex compressa]|nr:hypothetical protein KM043_000123 [Ampulex compressa]
MLMTRSEVMQNTGNISDHRYMSVELRALACPLRWILKFLGAPRLLGGRVPGSSPDLIPIMVSCWRKDDMEDFGETLDPLQRIEWIRCVLTAACSVAVCPIKSRPRWATYWWTNKITKLRVEAVRRAGSSFGVDATRQPKSEVGRSYRAAKMVL